VKSFQDSRANIYKLGHLPSIDIVLVIYQNRKYTTYQSVDRIDFLLSKEQIVSRSLDSIISQAKSTLDILISYP
jgi:hypothetical protein